MKFKLAAFVCIITMLVTQTAMAYSRSSQGYGSTQAGTEEEAEEVEIVSDTDDESYRDIPEESEEAPEMPGMSGTAIMGYVFLALGGMGAIAGSTIITASDKNTLGAIILGGGAALSLAGTLMITLGGHRGYAVGPAIDPKTNTYGVVVAKRF
jgi:hypothetical protein